MTPAANKLTLHYPLIFELNPSSAPANNLYVSICRYRLSAARLCPAMRGGRAQ
jgi:hypothetical protein